jgi:peptidoglycan/LPS O-acetylase OafA/YrhL
LTSSAFRRVAAALGIAAVAIETLLVELDATSTAVEIALLAIVIAACVAYGVLRADRSSMAIAALTAVGTVVLLELAVTTLGSNDDTHEDASPIEMLLAVPLIVLIVGIAAAARGRQQARTSRRSDAGVA